MLKQGSIAWNTWREQHPSEWLDLRSANLYHADLVNANLSGAELARANLNVTDIREANHSRADLSGDMKLGQFMQFIRETWGLTPKQAMDLLHLKSLNGCKTPRHMMLERGAHSNWTKNAR